MLGVAYDKIQIVLCACTKITLKMIALHNTLRFSEADGVDVINS